MRPGPNILLPAAVITTTQWELSLSLQVKVILTPRPPFPRTAGTPSAPPPRPRVSTLLPRREQSAESCPDQQNAELSASHDADWGLKRFRTGRWDLQLPADACKSQGCVHPHTYQTGHDANAVFPLPLNKRGGGGTIRGETPPVPLTMSIENVSTSLLIYSQALVS